MIKRFDDGSIYLEFTITHDMEIIPLIKQWLPHLRIIEPLRIRETIQEDILQFMKED